MQQFYFSLIFFLSVIAPAQANSISGPPGDPWAFKNYTIEELDLALLEEVVPESISVFESAFGKLEKPITITYGAKSCLRTGYHLGTQSVQFCPQEKSALQSRDTISHELFHAMLCQKHPDHCRSAIFSDLHAGALHEGLAFLFAYLARPEVTYSLPDEEDQGERDYHGHLCYALSAGVHGKGFAVTQGLLRARRSLKEIAEALRKSFSMQPLLPNEPCFWETTQPEKAPKITLKSAQLPWSYLQRYDLNVGNTVTFRFELNLAAQLAYPDLEIQWFATKPIAHTYVAVSPPKDKWNYVVTPFKPGPGKWIARFISGGAVIGAMPIYLLVRPEETIKKALPAENSRRR